MMKIQSIVAVSRQVALGLVVSAGLVASNPHADAQLIAYEGFDYPEGLLTDPANPDTNNGGFGWSGPWELRNASPKNEVVAAGLTYSDGTNDLAVTGGSNYTTASGSGVSKRLFDPAISGVDPGFYFENNRGFSGVNVLGVPETTIWLSFLSKTDTNPAGGPVFTQLYEDPKNFDRTKERTTSMGAIGLGQVGDIDQWAFFDIGNGTGAGAAFSAADVGDNMGDLVTTNTVFYVARIDYGPEAGPINEAPYEAPVDVKVNVWLNPDLSTEPLLANADLKNFLAPSGVVFNGIGMGGSAGGFFDEFRFGTTYVSVAPIAGEPSPDGDFDLDGDVDGADFLLWQRDTSVGSLSDWQTNFGATAGVASTSAVPEPSALVLVSVALAGLAIQRRR